MLDSSFASLIRVVRPLRCAGALFPADVALAQAPAEQKPEPPPAPADRLPVFDMGRIVVVGTPDGQPTVGGAVLTSEQIWTFDRKSLDQTP